MSVPTDKMIGIAISENAVNKVLRTFDWQKNKHPHIIKSWEASFKLFYMNTFLNLFVKD